MKMVDFWSIFLYMRLPALDLAYSVGWRHSLGITPYRAWPKSLAGACYQSHGLKCTHTPVLSVSVPITKFRR